MRTLLRSCSLAAVVLACALSAGATAQATPAKASTVQASCSPLVDTVACDAANYVIAENVAYLMGTAVVLPLAVQLVSAPTAAPRGLDAVVWHPPGGRQCETTCLADTNAVARPPAVIQL